MSWLVEAVLSVIAPLVYTVIDFFADKLTACLTLSPDIFNAYFSWMQGIQKFLIWAGVIIALAVGIFMLFRSLYAEPAGIRSESGYVIAGRMLAGAFIAFLSFQICLSVLSAGQKIILNTEVQVEEKTYKAFSGGGESINPLDSFKTFCELINNLTGKNEGSGDSGDSSGNENGSSGESYETLSPSEYVQKDLQLQSEAGKEITGSAASLLIVIILLVLVGYSYITFLIEIVERYAFVIFSVYLMPVASGFFASAETEDIAKKGWKMFLSTIFTYFIDLLLLQAIGYAMSNMIATTTKLRGMGYDKVNVVFAVVIMFGMIRIAKKMDSVVSEFLPTYRTNLEGEMMAAASLAGTVQSALSSARDSVKNGAGKIMNRMGDGTAADAVRQTVMPPAGAVAGSRQSEKSNSETSPPQEGVQDPAGTGKEADNGKEDADGSNESGSNRENDQTRKDQNKENSKGETDGGKPLNQVLPEKEGGASDSLQKQPEEKRKAGDLKKDSEKTEEENKEKDQ